MSIDDTVPEPQPLTRTEDSAAAAERATEPTSVRADATVDGAKEAKRQQRTLETILDCLPDKIALHQCDHTILSYNKSGNDMVGLRPSEIDGRRCFELLGRDRPCAECATAMALKTGHIEAIEAYVEEVAAWFLVRAIPMRGPDGSIEAIVEQLQDITARKRSERELQRLSDIVRRSPAVAFCWRNESDWPIDFVSANVETMLGYSATAFLTGQVRYADLVHPDDVARVLGEVREATGDADMVQFRHAPYRLITKSGNAIWVDDRTRLVRDSSGAVAAYEGIILDITTQVRSEQELRDSEKRFMDVLYASQDAILLIGDNQFIDCNEATTRLLGYATREEFLQTHPSKLSPPTQPDGRSSFEKAEEMMQLAFERGFHRFDWVHRRANGEDFPVEISLTPVLYAGKSLLYCVWRDVTERVEREQAHEHTVRRFMAMINTVPALMYVKDIDHQYIAANEAFCRAVGRPLDQLIGLGDFDLFPWERADGYEGTDQVVMDEDRKVIGHEEHVTDAEGNERWVSVTKVPLHDKQGLVAGVVGLVQDVTEHHRSREQLVQSDKLAAIGTLAAGVAHEINNPIGFISSNLNTMAKYVEKIDTFLASLGIEERLQESGLRAILTDFTDAISESKDGAVRVKNIVADLKSFSRVDQSQECLANLNEGIQSTLNIVWNELKYKCTVEKDLGDIPDLLCIPNQLNQVFMNLLLNASHAISGEGGIVKIATWADAEHIFVRVTDNGCGIEQKNLKKIFEPFFTTKEVGKGTGLGLSLAYDIIEKHGGRIDVRSEVGEGSEFTIILPIRGAANERLE